MKRKTLLIRSLLFLVVLTVIYLCGPVPPKLHLNPKLPELHVEPVALEKSVIEREKAIQSIKPNNASSIIWNDSIAKNKTPYCIVYLHGFSASPMEGNPVATDIAKKFGCNLYMPRLFAHGLNNPEPMLEYNETDYLESAKQAVAEAANLGEKVIIMGTSTGCTLALYIASGNPSIAGLILYSPNIELYDPRAFILTQPWGLYIARLVAGGKYHVFDSPEEAKQYWNTRYRLEAVVKMKNFLNYSMKKETFEAIHQPVLLCYYRKNEQEQDTVVSVSAMLQMFDELGTPPDLKRKVNIPAAQAHPLASAIWAKDIPSVEKATSEFMDEVMKIESK